tara:strand:+ start:304 stop:558 length:255 start_codon:yes stop_codon:yes gene_type:complete
MPVNIRAKKNNKVTKLEYLLSESMKIVANVNIKNSDCRCKENAINHKNKIVNGDFFLRSKKIDNMKIDSEMPLLNALPSNKIAE